MFRYNCLYCKKSTTQSLCSTCENHLLRGLKRRERFMLCGEDLIKHTYFWDYGGVCRKLILSGKYKFKKQCFQALSTIITDHYFQLFDQKSILTYVPTTYLRYCFRGFNQAKVIADYLKGSNKIVKLAKRKQFLGSQSKNDKIHRQSRDSQFICTKTVPEGSKIIVIDDICTTGATFTDIGLEILDKNPTASLEFYSLAYKHK